MSEKSVPISSSGRQYRTPSEHGDILAVPELPTALELAERNADQLNAIDNLVSFPEFSKFREQTRSEVISRAVEWTNRVTGQNIACAECSHHASLTFVTGHQPQLAHAGVWAKNFAAAGLAQNSKGLGLNIIVDNDTVGTQSIHVPTGTRENPRYENISFDSAQLQQPWEELRIQDRSLFEKFNDRVEDVMSQWEISPLIYEMWPTAIQTSHRTDSMVECLAACRMIQERKWGISNLEIPLSEVCQTDAFLKFARHLIVHSRLFHSNYNEIVRNYRRENGIRNDRHPVPDLESSDGMIEIPFWFWRENDVERGQVFVRESRNRFQLYSKDEMILDSTEQALLDDLRELQLKGKLRTRALTTTLFARLFLADMFIHGIGGAKYDEITDLLMQDFYGIEPPEFLVLSATLHLPIEGFPVTAQEEIDLKSKLRDYKFNADRYVSGPVADQLKSRKAELIKEHWSAQTQGLSKQERQKFRIRNRKRHLELKNVNESLAELAGEELSKLEAELDQITQELKANSVLRSREYSASIFPSREIQNLAESFINPKSLEFSRVDCSTTG